MSKSNYLTDTRFFNAILKMCISFIFLEEPEKALIEFNKSQQNTPPRHGLFD